jgi:hypothetical protein
MNVRARRHVGDPRSGFVIALLLTIASQPRPCRHSAMIVECAAPHRQFIAEHFGS